MGRFSKPGKAPEKKYSYTEFLKGEGQPTSAAANTAASYSSKSANSAAMQVQLESSKKRPSFASPPPVRHTRCSPGAMWMHLLTLCQLLGAAGVIGVVAICLNKREQFPATTTSGNSTLPITASVCYATTRTVNACLYAYWAGAASIALSIIISAMNICCPRRRYALCLSFEAVLGLLGTAWWIAAAVTGGADQHPHCTQGCTLA